MPSLALVLALAACGSGGALTGTVAAPELSLAGSQDLAAVGTQGTTVPAQAVTYELTNVGDANLDWQVVASAGWVSVTPTAGMLAPQASATVSVAVGASASSLPTGEHNGTLQFRNLNNGRGNQQRPTTLSLTGVGSEPMTAAVSTTGVAPLTVVFDATTSGNGVVRPSGTLPDFASFTYEWSFGDPASGTWPHNGKSKNTGTGWIGAHVYEVPGAYRATLRVTTDQGVVTEYHQDITVTDPNTVFAARTFYVAATGSDSNPGSESQPFQTLARGVSAAFATSQPTRVLFRRGDTFTTGTSQSSGQGAAAVLIGAYGTGAKPVLRMGGTYGGINLVRWDDARLVDLHLVATSASSMVQYARGISMGTRTTLLRCTIEGFPSALDGSDVNNATAAECELLNSAEYGIYAYGPSLELGNHLAFLGNRLDQANFHLTRCYLNRSIFQANLYQRGGLTAMALVGRTQAAPSQLNCIVDNTYTTETFDVVAMGPANNTFQEYARDYLFEGNRFTSRNESGNCIHIRGFRTTIRNNVFDVTGRQAVDVSPWQNSAIPAPSDIRIEHNTVYRGTGSPLRFLTANSTNPTIARNNLLHCAQGSVQAASGTVSLTQNLTANPLFTDAPAGDFTLRSGSPAIDTAVPTTVRTDFARQRRLGSATSDVGAFEAGN